MYILIINLTGANEYAMKIKKMPKQFEHADFAPYQIITTNQIRLYHKQHIRLLLQ